VSCCIFATANQGLGNAPAFLQRPIKTLEMLLHFAATQSTPWLASCIFETQSRMPIKLGRGWHE